MRLAKNAGTTSPETPGNAVVNIAPSARYPLASITGGALPTRAPRMIAPHRSAFNGSIGNITAAHTNGSYQRSDTI